MGRNAGYVKERKMAQERRGTESQIKEKLEEKIGV